MAEQAGSMRQRIAGLLPGVDAALDMAGGGRILPGHES
jgi:hypothetical protein